MRLNEQKVLVIPGSVVRTGPLKELPIADAKFSMDNYIKDGNV